MFDKIKSLYSCFISSIYDRMLIDAEEKCLKDWRQTMLSGITGDVLEIGAGTGANLPYYSNKITSLVLTEPNVHMRQKLTEKAKDYNNLPIKQMDCAAESIPAEDASFDVVVCTLVLCSVDNPQQALAEIYRVLRPAGKLVFIEHVIATNRPDRLKWQERLEPVWKRLQCGCHLTRDTEKRILDAGFSFETIGRQSMRGVPPIVRPCIRGVAVKLFQNWI